MNSQIKNNVTNEVPQNAVNIDRFGVHRSEPSFSLTFIVGQPVLYETTLCSLQSKFYELTDQTCPTDSRLVFGEPGTFNCERLQNT